jgi:hypothetical protein
MLIQIRLCLVQRMRLSLLLDLLSEYGLDVLLQKKYLHGYVRG